MALSFYVFSLSFFVSGGGIGGLGFADVLGFGVWSP